MIKIIGKFFLSFALFNGFVVAEDIKLSVQDVHGAATSQVFVGKPFTLEVEVTGFSNNIPEPTLKNVGDYSIQRTGMYMSTINGYSTKKYSYLVRIDDPGKYHIGPAIIEINGNRYESEEIILSVEQFLHGANTTKNVKKQEAFAYLITDKDSVVVGEKIKSTLTFYTNNPDVRITDFSPGIATTLEYENIRGPEVGLESMNGVEYHFARWTWDAYATTSGELVLPACSLQYVIPSRKDYRLGGFGSILGIGNETKKIYSNPQSIIVESIEKYAHVVDAVGTFNHFGATIAPGVCKAGEGMILTITLSGDGNWNRIPEFTLQNIPKNLRYYSSETSFTQDDVLGLRTKKMEFIIQASEPGDFIIPSQKFTFFDIETKTNKTLSTAQLDITILPNDTILTVEIEPKLPKVLNKEDSIEQKSDLIGLLYIFQDRKKSTPTPIAWWMFLICILFPVLLFFSTFPLFKNSIQSNIFYRYIRNKRLFYKARKEALYAQEHARPDLLYNLFVKLICNYYLVSYVSFDQLQPKIEKLLDKTINNGKNWKDFFSYITEIAFTKKTTVKDSVYTETLFWINRLEKEL